MLIYFSGNGRSAAVGPRNCDPENVVKGGCLMLTYAQCGQSDNNQTPRMKAFAQCGQSDNNQTPRMKALKKARQRRDTLLQRAQ